MIRGLAARKKASKWEEEVKAGRIALEVLAEA